MSRRILVTGATGETGRYTIDLLICQRLEVRAFVHSAGVRSAQLEARGAKIVVGDLLEFAAAREAVGKGARS